MKWNLQVRWLLVLALLGLTVLVVFSGGAAAGETGAAGQEIKIDNFSFAPQTMTVPVGTQVTWTNRDDIPHTVVSEDKTTFKSHALDTDEKFSFTFRSQALTTTSAPSIPR